MLIRYDPEVGALSVVFRETTVTTRELADGIVAEYDADDRIVGLKILDAEARFGDPGTLGEIVLEGVGLGEHEGTREEADRGGTPMIP